MIWLSRLAFSVFSVSQIFPKSIFKSFLIIIGCLLISNNIIASDYPFEKEKVKKRLSEMECLVQTKYNTPVEGYLRNYLERYREKSERILGKSTIYFPLFEKELKKRGMPADLKYLSVVESALEAKALSRVGAGGLWQFMPATGEAYGLKIDRYIDERSCPQKSTEAALTYLQKLYDKYENWELVFAAYNAGRGRVNRAIKRARSKNFWKVARYLPRETRNYVPAYIAATYLFKHYKEHELEPLFPDLDVQLTETIRIHQYISFYTIQKITGLSRDMVDYLNPAYTHGFIPSNREGNYLTLPRRVLLAYYDFVQATTPDVSPVKYIESKGIYTTKNDNRQSKDRYYQTSYYTMEGDSLEGLAHLFNIDTFHLKLWNKLDSTQLSADMEINLYFPTGLLRYRKPSPPVDRIPHLTIPTLSATPVKKQHRPIQPNASYVVYTVKKYESLRDIADRYPGVTVQHLLQWNDLRGKKSPKGGFPLKIYAL